MKDPKNEPVLVTGATGYVGGRLAPYLLQAGYRVRVMGRSVRKLGARPWAQQPGVEIVAGDVFDPDSLTKALQGCGTAYYLVHSMNPTQKNFVQADRTAARNMAAACAQAGVERIIYLGGLGVKGPQLSKHLRSRTEVAEILQSSPVPTTFLRAAVILGSGSASCEMLRYLVERLPIMITPSWVQTPCQPIAIRNVLEYLKGCLEHPETSGETFDIGGPDILTYRSLMDIYAEEAGIPRRWVLPVPFLTPRLSSYWVHLITPVPSSLARPLIEGLRNPVVCQENRIRDIIPQDLLSCRQALRIVLQRVAQQQVDTCWSDAGSLTAPEWATCGDAPYAGGTVLQCNYRVVLKATPEEVWRPIQEIGGRRGWYGAMGLWRIRGALDRLSGGVGLRRGRRHPTALYVGDALDFWRVLLVERGKRLQLLAEMKLPGEALLDFVLLPAGPGLTVLEEQSRFLPRGLLGLLYWYLLYPFHQWVFKRMLQGIAKAVGRPVLRGPERLVTKA